MAYRFFHRLYLNLLFFKIEKEMKIEQAFSFPLFNFQKTLNVYIRAWHVYNMYSDVFAIDVYFDYFSYLMFRTFTGQ